MISNKKYGGDFCYIDLKTNSKNEFEKYFSDFNFILYDSGRSALRALLKKLNRKTILLPDFICQSIVDTILSLNIEIAFYHINIDLSIDIKDLKHQLVNNSIIFFINYFGHLQDELILNKITELSKVTKSLIIEDTTHSIFTKIQTIGDYCIASLRKWFPLCDDGICYTQNELNLNRPLEINKSFVNYRHEAMTKKSNSYEFNFPDEAYLNLYKTAENCLNLSINEFSISNKSKDILYSTEITTIVSARKNNFKLLDMKINNKNLIKIIKYNPTETLLAYPVYVNDRDDFVKYLIEHKIYCAIHWPNLIGTNITHQDTLYRNNHIISIMLDQRYLIADMKYLINIVNNY